MILQVYTTCTTDTDPDGKYWCSTKGVDFNLKYLDVYNYQLSVDSNGLHVRGNWGYCEGQCETSPPAPPMVLGDR